MSEQRRILVTGAGGFIGGRMVEIMHALGVGEVRAGLRRWASGARIGRLPIEMVQCDIRDPEQVRSALEGVTHLVHCAVGDHSTTVEGTRALFEAALEAGVKRVVHLSTIDVYGTTEGEIDETYPLTTTGQPYGDTKIAAEEVCREMVKKGLHVTILRPTLVHGPFSATWTLSYASRLHTRPWLVAEADAQGTCNLVYVDDLVGATMKAFDADIPSGEAFNISGPEHPTWHAYFKGLNDAMGLPPLTAASVSGARMRAGGMQPLRASAKFLVKHFEGPIKGLGRRSPVARDLMVRAEGILRTVPAPVEFVIYSRKTSFSTSKAERMLGYQPRFPLSEAMPLTGAWLRDNGYVRNGAG